MGTTMFTKLRMYHSIRSDTRLNQQPSHRLGIVRCQDHPNPSSKCGTVQWPDDIISQTCPDHVQSKNNGIEILHIEQQANGQRMQMSHTSRVGQDHHGSSAELFSLPGTESNGIRGDTIIARFSIFGTQTFESHPT